MRRRRNIVLSLPIRVVGFSEDENAEPTSLTLFLSFNQHLPFALNFHPPSFFCINSTDGLFIRIIYVLVNLHLSLFFLPSSCMSVGVGVFFFPPRPTDYTNVGF